MSGLQINNPKSQIFYANMDVEVKDHLLQSLNFKEGTLPVKYLGLPLISTKLSIADCMPLIEKVKQKLNSWTSKMLSDSGRVQLVKSVALQLQAYWCGAFLLPAKVQKIINIACRDFIWGSTKEKTTMPLVAWDTICFPKNEGGLGLKQTKVWNIAALSKKVWAISRKQNDLWTTWAQKILLRNQSL